MARSRTDLNTSSDEINSLGRSNESPNGLVLGEEVSELLKRLVALAALVDERAEVFVDGRAVLGSAVQEGVDGVLA